jgi:pectinesterase
LGKTFRRSEKENCRQRALKRVLREFMQNNCRPEKTAANFFRPAGVVAAAIFLGAQVRAQTRLEVAPDGSAKFKSVQEAIMSIPAGSPTHPVAIHIKPGIYKELIYLQREKRFFNLVGDDPGETVLSCNLYANLTNHDGRPIGTFRTPSTTIDADDFTAEHLTFENNAGPKGQALAIGVDGDRATFRDCHFLGWQDTIFLNRGRQFFEKCYIAGHVDFIFGAATAFFEKCQIQCLGDGYITAASTPFDQPFGFVFANCKIAGDKPGTKSFLGRPWRIDASTIFLNTEMTEVIRPEGWNNWGKAQAGQTRYEEFGSTGAGASPKTRANWSRQLTKCEAKGITLKKVLGGADGWNPKWKNNLIGNP